MVNNHDQSSTGINLELDVFRDCERSQLDFEDSFVKYQDESYRKHAILIWTQFANISIDPDFFNSEDAFKIPQDMSETDLLETLKDRIDEVSYQVIAESYFDLKETLSFESVMNHAETELDDGYFQWKEDYLIPQYEEVDVRGYCQGDFVKVIVPYKTVEGTVYHPDYEGVDKRPISDMAKLFRNIIFDAPVTGKLEVNIPKHTGFETEINLHGGLEDQYKYDKDEIVKVVSSDPHIQKLPNEDREYILFWVNDNLPDDPEYIH